MKRAFQSRELSQDHGKHCVVLRRQSCLGTETIVFTGQQTFQKCSELYKGWELAYDNWVDSGNPDVDIGDWLSMYWGAY